MQKSKIKMTKELMIHVFKKVSLLDLSDAFIEYGFLDHQQYCQALFNHVVKDGMTWDGNVFRMMNNDGSFDLLNPMSSAFEAMESYACQSSPVWVKASERLPIKQGYYCCKIFGDRYIGLQLVYRNNLVFIDEKNRPIKPKNVLWLDDTPSESGSSTTEDQEALWGEAINVYVKANYGFYPALKDLLSNYTITRNK